MPHGYLNETKVCVRCGCDYLYFTEYDLDTGFCHGCEGEAPSERGLPSPSDVMGDVVE